MNLSDNMKQTSAYNTTCTSLILSIILERITKPHCANPSQDWSVFEDYSKIIFVVALFVKMQQKGSFNVFSELVPHLLLFTCSSMIFSISILLNFYRFLLTQEIYEPVVCLVTEEQALPGHHSCMNCSRFKQNQTSLTMAIHTQH